MKTFPVNYFALLIRPSSRLLKLAVALWIGLSFGKVQGQVVTNGSFEATQAAAEAVPPGWMACHGSTDIQPIGGGQGVFGLETEAARGNTYLGMIATQNQTYYESVGQAIELVAGSDYSGSVALHCSQAHPSWDGVASLRLFGGQHCGDANELLWESGPVKASSGWQSFAIEFAPVNNHSFLVLMAQFESGSGTMAYLLVDDLEFNQVLPVELGLFGGMVQGETVALNWEVATPQVGQRFEVRWSDDPAVSAFQSLGEVSAVQDQAQYEFVHGLPSPGVNYYQLQITDENGQRSSSQVVAVAFDGVAESRIWPQPSGGLVHVRSPWSDGPVKAEVLDVTGRILISQDQLPTSFELDLENTLEPGHYFLRLTHSQGQSTHRIVIR